MSLFNQAFRYIYISKELMPALNCLGDNCQPGDQSFNEGDTHQGALEKVLIYKSSRLWQWAVLNWSRINLGPIMQSSPIEGGDSGLFWGCQWLRVYQFYHAQGLFLRWWLWAVLVLPIASSSRLWQVLDQRRASHPRGGDLLNLRLILFLNLDDLDDCDFNEYHDGSHIQSVLIWLCTGNQGPTAYLGHDFSGVSYINLTSGRYVNDVDNWCGEWEWGW